MGAKVVAPGLEFNREAINILRDLERMINTGQWQKYNKKLDKLIVKYGDNPEILKIIKDLKVKNTKDFRLKHKKAGTE